MAARWQNYPSWIFHGGNGERGGAFPKSGGLLSVLSNGNTAEERHRVCVASGIGISILHSWDSRHWTAKCSRQCMLTTQRRTSLWLGTAGVGQRSGRSAQDEIHTSRHIPGSHSPIDPQWNLERGVRRKERSALCLSRPSVEHIMAERTLGPLHDVWDGEEAASDTHSTSVSAGWVELLCKGCGTRQLARFRTVYCAGGGTHTDTHENTKYVSCSVGLSAGKRRQNLQACPVVGLGIMKSGAGAV